MRLAYSLTIHCLWAIAIAAELSAAELRGRVVDETNSPISDASVTIWIGRPLVGKAGLCPSCYIDCGRTATTNHKGVFAFADVADDLAYTVVAAANGFRANQSGWMNGDNEGEVKLSAIPADLPMDRLFQGRITDPQGRPIPVAEIEPTGIRRERDYGTYGSMRGKCDELAISDHDGRFSVVIEQPAVSISLRVRARGFAPRFLQDVELTDAPFEFSLYEGGSVLGRVTKDDEGMPDRMVGLCPTTRSMLESMTGWGSFDQTTLTDAVGNFRFDDLPADFKFYVYTISSATHNDATDILQVTAPAAGKQIDLGHLPLQSTQTIRGRVLMPEDHSIPNNVRMVVSRDDVWDAAEIPLQKDGSFEVFGVRQGLTKLSVPVPGYRLDWDRNNLQQTYENQIGIFVEGDVDDLPIYMVERPVAE